MHAGELISLLAFRNAGPVAGTEESWAGFGARSMVVEHSSTEM